MKHKVNLVLSFILLLSFLLVPGSAFAQGDRPPQLPTPGAPGKPDSGNLGEETMPPVGGAQRDEKGYWFVKDEDSAEAVEPEIESLAMTSAHDEYGNTRSGAHYGWIDAYSGGQQLSDVTVYGSSVIDLPFGFKFYENAYNQVEVSQYGYMTFNQGSGSNLQARIPYPDEYNNIIAAYWAPISPGYDPDTGQTGGVYRMDGQTGDGMKYVVIEWYKMQDWTNNTLFTLEAILYEDGSILLQYERMNYNVNHYRYLWYYCASAGIENITGEDGINSLPYCARQGSYRAVRFARPQKPMARLRVTPKYDGKFAIPDEGVIFQVDLLNLGDMGTETYHIKVNSLWPANLFAADGITPLIDIDGDKLIETDPVGQGEGTTVVVKVAVPPTAVVGNSSTTVLTIWSSLNQKIKKVTQLQASVPASFAQVYASRGPAPDRVSDGRLLMVQRLGGQNEVSLLNAAAWPNDLAVVETASGNLLTVWTGRDCSSGNYCGDVIHYSLRDHSGAEIKAGALNDVSGLQSYENNYSIVLAGAPDGKVGIIWNNYQYYWDPYNTEFFRYNIRFAVLDGSTGDTLAGPVEVTQYDFATDSYASILIYDPTIAATDNGGFYLAWEQDSWYEDPNGNWRKSGWIWDVYTAILDNTGAVLLPVEKATADKPGSASWCDYPLLVKLQNNTFLLAWNQPTRFAYQVFDSNRNPLTAPKYIGHNRGDYFVQGVQLSDGNILLAWSGWHGSRYQTAYVTVNGVTFKKNTAVKFLDHPAAMGRSYFVSVTRDDQGNGILTWGDYATRDYLYYALVNGMGKLMNVPAIFARGNYLYPRREVSNTTYSIVGP